MTDQPDVCSKRLRLAILIQRNGSACDAKIGVLTSDAAEIYGTHMAFPKVGWRKVAYSAI